MAQSKLRRAIELVAAQGIHIKAVRRKDGGLTVTELAGRRFSKASRAGNNLAYQLAGISLSGAETAQRRKAAERAARSNLSANRRVSALSPSLKRLKRNVNAAIRRRGGDPLGSLELRRVYEREGAKGVKAALEAALDTAADFIGDEAFKEEVAYLRQTGFQAVHDANGDMLYDWHGMPIFTQVFKKTIPFLNKNKSRITRSAMDRIKQSIYEWLNSPMYSSRTAEAFEAIDEGIVQDIERILDSTPRQGNGRRYRRNKRRWFGRR